MNFITKRKHLMTRIRKDSNKTQITIGVTAIIVISFTLANIIPQTAKAQENIQQNEFIQKMTEIDDIAHQYDKILHDIGTGYNMKWDRVFHIADNKYHTTQERDGKFKAAMELNTLILEQNTFVHQMIQENPFSEEVKARFDQMQKDINQMK